MERPEIKARIRSRDWVRQRHAAGWRTVSALMPPELVEQLDRLAAGRPRAHVLMELIEQAVDTQKSGGGA